MSHIETIQQEWIRTIDVVRFDKLFKAWKTEYLARTLSGVDIGPSQELPGLELVKGQETVSIGVDGRETGTEDGLSRLGLCETLEEGGGRGRLG